LTAFPRFLGLRLKALSARGDLLSIPQGVRLGGEAIVLSRALCGFERRKTSRNDAKGRKAITLAIQRESPDAEVWIERAVSRDAASVNTWRWSGEKIAAALGGVKNAAVMPETLARAPGGDGLRLVPCIDGFEGEYWIGGELIASRWWPRQPDAASWAVFVRAARAQDVIGDDAGALAPPAPTLVEWRDDLTLLDGALAAKQPILRPAPLAKWLFILLAPFIVFEQAKSFSQAQYIRRLEARIAEQEEASAEFLRARRFARREQARIQNARNLGDESTVLAALAPLAAALKETDASVSRVLLRDGALEVRVKDHDGRANAELVAALEATPYWRSVSLQNVADGSAAIRGEVFGIMSREPSS